MAESKFAHRIQGQHYVDGKLLSGFFPLEMIPMLQQFEMLEDDYIVAAYPKSGKYSCIWKFSYGCVWPRQKI